MGMNFQLMLILDSVASYIVIIVRSVNNIIMKTKLESSNPIYQKQKNIAYAIKQKYGGSIVINVEPQIDEPNTLKKEFYIKSIQNRLSNNIEVLTSNDIDNNLTSEFDLSNVVKNNKSNEIVFDLYAMLLNHGCKVL